MRTCRSIGLHILGVLFLMGGQAGAVSFTSTATGFFSSTIFDSDGDGFTAFFLSVSGSTTAFGSFVCSAVSESVFVAPTGACGPSEFESAILPETSRSHCQFEGTEDIVNFTSTGTGCLPSSCLDASFIPIVGCSSTFTGTITTLGGDGVFEGATGSSTFSQTATYTQVDVLPSGFVFVAGTLSQETQGEATLAGGDPPTGAFIDVPAEGSNNSGIGNVSIWSCLGGNLEVEFSDAAGVINTLPIPYGSERLDVEATCGKENTGGSLPINWSLLGTGEKTIRLIRNGEEVAIRNFFVTAFDTEFVSGASGMCTVDDFPTTGQSATFGWEESQQGLALSSAVE